MSHCTVLLYSYPPVYTAPIQHLVVKSSGVPRAWKCATKNFKIYNAKEIKRRQKHGAHR